MEQLFKELEFIESLYNRNIINLEEYFKIKSSIVDYYKPKEDNKGDLPF